MNAIYITLLLREIAERVEGRSLTRVLVPRPGCVELGVSGSAEALVLDAGTVAPRLGFDSATTGAGRTDAEPALVRLVSAIRESVGSRIERLEQPGGDRWLHLRLSGKRRVVWENLGRRANLVVLAGEKITACLREYPPGEGVTRAVLEGEAYPPAPAAAPVNPLHDAGADDARIDIGLGPGLHSPGALDALRAGRGAPGVVRPPAVGTRVRLVWHLPDDALLARAGLEGARVEEHDSFAAAAAAWGAASAQRAKRLGWLRALRSHWGEKERRARRALQALERDHARAVRHPEYRRFGEALVASFPLLKRGAAEARVPDPSDPNTTLFVPLQPDKSPRENADRYFRQAKRGERAIAVLEARREKLLGEATRAAEARAPWEERAGEERAESHPDELRAAAVAAGLIDARSARRGGRAATPHSGRGPASRGGAGAAGGGGPPRSRRPDPLHGAKLHRFEVSGGFTVYVGKTNSDNDLLTHKIARPWDLWFHSGQSAGSHVVLVKGNAKASPPKEALLEAAALAAHYSKARNAGTVPVIYTEKRFVRKPRKGPPGLATCQREKTLFVRPDPLAEKRWQGEG